MPFAMRNMHHPFVLQSVGLILRRLTIEIEYQLSHLNGDDSLTPCGVEPSSHTSQASTKPSKRPRG